MAQRRYKGITNMGSIPTTCIEYYTIINLQVVKNLLECIMCNV